MARPGEWRKTAEWRTDSAKQLELAEFASADPRNEIVPLSAREDSYILVFANSYLLGADFDRGAMLAVGTKDYLDRVH
jgi:hypothetical protein